MRILMLQNVSLFLALVKSFLCKWFELSASKGEVVEVLLRKVARDFEKFIR